METKVKIVSWEEITFKSISYDSQKNSRTRKSWWMKLIRNYNEIGENRCTFTKKSWTFQFCPSQIRQMVTSFLPRGEPKCLVKVWAELPSCDEHFVDVVLSGNQVSSDIFSCTERSTKLFYSQIKTTFCR